jgi:YARHG domain-containing protein
MLLVDQPEFWKIVEATKPEKLRALSDEEIRDCQNYFLETLDSTLPAYKSVTASLRLVVLRGEIDLRHSDARHRQTQRLARLAIGVGILSAAVILSAVAAIVFGLANRPTPEPVPAAATEATEIPAIIAASKQPKPIATQPQRTAAKDLTVLPTEHVARAEQPQQEVGAKEEFPVRNSPTIAHPSIAPARGPWLFPDSSSRYLKATELSSLSSADLWRARNEIYARKGYKFSGPRGTAFVQTLGSYYRGVDHDQGRVFNNMNQYERANVTLIRSIERGR